jgi:hypothetical protein
MEQFECIALAAPVAAGDLISKEDTYELRAAGLVAFDGAWAWLTARGHNFYATWRRVNGDPPDYPIFR